MKSNTWEWTEASEAEFERRRRKETYFRIFHVTGPARRPRKVTVYKFWAKDRAEAYAVLKDYRRAHRGREFYYGRSGTVIGPEGQRYDDLMEMLDLPKTLKRDAKSRARAAKFAAERKRLFGGVKDCLKSLKIKDKHLRTVVDDIGYFVANYDLVSFSSHQRSESSDILGAILDTLTFNLPLMIANGPAVPYACCERARLRMKERKKANGDISPAAMKLAGALWRKELERLLLYVRLYRFYDGYGHADERDPSEAEIARKYGKTVPYHRGTYDDIDYARLQKLRNRYWRLWTMQLQRIGRDLWT